MKLMAFKEFVLADNLPVKIYKRKTSRTLRLSIGPTGEVKVSIPSWSSYASGLSFAASKLTWIQAQLPDTGRLLRHGQAIGKAHRLYFAAKPAAAVPSSRLRQSLITVSYPLSLSVGDRTVQEVAANACLRALRSQAERLLPQRLEALANQHGYSYSSVGIKKLKGRWGSCDTNRHIVLNLYLMQLPWELIDYVLVHELVHTQVMQHGPAFWAEMERVRPGAKAERGAIRAHQPFLYAGDPQAMA